MRTMFWRVNLREESLGRPRRNGKDNIKMALQEIGCGYGMVWLRIGAVLGGEGRIILKWSFKK